MLALMGSKKNELISVAKTDQLAIKKPPFENTTLYIDMAISSDPINEKPSLIMSCCLSLLLMPKIIINLIKKISFKYLNKGMNKIKY